MIFWATRNTQKVGWNPTRATFLVLLTPVSTRSLSRGATQTSGWLSLPGMALRGCQKCGAVSTLPFPHRHFQSKDTLSAEALLLSPWSQPGPCYTVSPCAWSTVTATCNPAPQRPKHTITTWPSHFTPNSIPDVTESTSAHSSVTHNSRKVGATWLPTPAEQVHNTWYVRVTEHRFTIRWNEVLTPATTRMNLKKSCSVEEARHKRTNTGWFYLKEANS